MNPSKHHPYMEFDQFMLRSYSAKEIERLSVLRIYQCKTFDALGFPIEGGLYDTALGPFENFEKCSTCGQGSHHCPGHLGHICLEVPVFNPVYFPLMLNLLKGTCVNCHKFMCNTDGPATKLLLAQLRCIELGLTDHAEALANVIKDKLSNSESKEDAENMLEKITSFNLHDIDVTIQNLTGKNINTLMKEKGIPSKNAVEFKRSLLKDYMKTHLFRHRVKCPLCKRRNSKFRNDGHRAVLLDFGVGGIFGKKTMKGKLKKGDDADGDEDAMGLDDNGPIEEFLDKMEKEKAISADFLRNDSALTKQLEAIQSGKCTKLIWRGAEAREHFRMVWKHDGEVLQKLFPLFEIFLKDNSCPMDKLFYELLIVPPNKFRPIRVFKGDRFEDPQTVGFRRIMEVNQLITYVKSSINESGYTVGDADIRTAIEAKLGKGTLVEKLHRAYLDLQLKVNSLYDSELNKMEPRPIPGIRQLLEKKQGLFRMHMMGKRVDYACRSVITPDPYLDVDEIGIPEIFAKKLTFAEIPNLLNLQELRQAVINGPEKYPGASFVRLINGRKEAIHPEDHFADDRRGKSRRLQVPTDSLPNEGIKSKEDGTGIKIVYRHLKKGEMVLMNRQPSLHKPSIMGHRVRILKTQKALRMNYAPCKAYNADFDGDEMNGHFIQNRIGQVEAAELANVGSSYLVPKDGTPILGLIQDHVVSGVLLTVRDTFLDKQEFMQLLLSAFAQTTQRIKMPPPAIIHPRKLWTGKQIVTAIVQNCSPKNAHLINLTAKAKTSVNCWKVDGHDAPKFEMSESEVIFCRGALVNGVLDKAHYGATQYGLIHCCFELYGHKVATRIMSCFSRCFTTYLQSHGFSLGVADILVKEEANKKRKEIIKTLRKEGDNVVRKTFGLSDDAPKLKLKHVLASAYNNARRETTDVKMFDFTMKQTIGKLNDKINEACIPDGLIRRFPQNSLQLMIQSGAKGSAVNAIQISCALGQIELEGQRPPLSATGRTLPSFHSFDTTPRAGGFVDQRFLTGINPQELFFHTMAGREGLIDTAVKTSRSGYLQRCIIKHLEGITVQYDGTCRDHDGSVMQFRYGEDGFDVGKATFMNPKQFPFLYENLAAVRDLEPKNVCQGDFKIVEAEEAYKEVRKYRRKVAKIAKENPNVGKVFSSGFYEFSKHFAGDVGLAKTITDRSKIITEKWFELSVEERNEWEESAVRHIPKPVDVEFNPYTTLGALPEKTLDQIYDFYKAKNIDDVRLRHALFWKGLRALAEPGENVGLLAAQSIGEPSTQMTLNTFHFAGRGDMNVTLGIPRLREILMTSGKNIATPTAEITILDTATEEDIEKLKQTFNRVYLKKCLKNVKVKEKLDVRPESASRIYEISIEVLPSRARDPATKHLTRKTILKQMEATFIKSVNRIINSKIRDAQEFVAIIHRKSRSLATNRNVSGENDEEGQEREYAPNDDGASSDEEVAHGADDANEARLANRHQDDAAEYEGEDAEEEDIQVRDPERNMADNFAVYSDDSEAEDENVNDESMNETTENGLKSREESDLSRITAVKDSGNYVENYEFDRKHNRWCVYTLRLNLDRYKVDVNSIVESVIDKFIVHQTDKIEKCVIREENKNGKDIKVLQTQGINVEAFYNNAHVLDINTIYSNDITLMASKYGIESCHRSIVKEMNNVFGVYGIDVNPRHLTLVADYMTFTGSIAPFSRTAMASSTSSLQKMTFETTMSFMRETLVHGDTDYLNGPSSRLVTGQLIKGGTGSFQLIENPEYVLGTGIYEAPKVSNRQRIEFTDSE